MMRRREFIAGLGSAAAWPVVARAQAGMPVIGFLSSQSADNEYKSVAVPFLQGLKEHSYVDGQNVACGAVANVAQRSGIFKEVRVVGCGEVPQAVRDSEIKAGIKGSFIDTLYAQRHGVYEPDVQMSMSYRPKFVVQRGMATRKGDALLSTLNTSLAKLRNDGTIKMIFTRYGI
jgi:hypothetical protein